MAEMSFRRTKPDHKRVAAGQAWIDRHWPALKAIGVPPVVCRDYDHWDDFLENGCLDFHPDPTHFSFQQLSAEQQVQLRQFLEREYGERERIPPLLGWLRHRQDRAAALPKSRRRPGSRH